MDLDNIRIVLIGTTHPGNIGATARAMKTMGLKHLRLVGPRHFPHDEATARASGADDVLNNTVVYDNLPAAVSDCVAVVGASARLRTLHWPTLTPRKSAQRLIAEAAAGPVAAVFGREKAGLSNDELDHCQWLLHIPANPDYASLNLAMAVQIVAYELRLAAGMMDIGTPAREAPPAAEMEMLYEHLDQVMLETGFLDPKNPRYLKRRMRLLLNRARPDQNEVNILRGLLTAIQRLQSRRDRYE